MFNSEQLSRYIVPISSFATTTAATAVPTRSEEKEQNELSNRVALGIYTKSHATLENTRLVQYALQSRARELLPKERVSTCLRCRVTKEKPVSVKYNKSRKKAHYDNVQRCGWVWGCPVCASKITEKRKVEVKKAMDSHQSNGGGCYMLTLTIPHYMGDNLKLLLSGLSVAMKHFFNGTRKSKAIWADMGKIGHIRALEVTYGSNGWHPHFHVMIFTKEPLKSGYNLTPLIELWQNACRLAKLPIPSFEHGLDWKKGNYSEYVTKWGMESEITKGHVKQGRLGSLTAWDMLRASMFQLDPKAEKMGKLFQEFAISFRKQRQLVWSRGLKEMFGINDQTDEQLADETDKQAHDVMPLYDMVWSLICRYHRRADLLHCVEYDQQKGTNTAHDLIMMLAEFEADKMRIASKNKIVKSGAGACVVYRPPPTPAPLWYDEKTPDLDLPDWVVA